MTQIIKIFIIWKSEVTGDYILMSRNWFNWHHVTVIGDIKDAVIAFAEKIGYEVVMQS